MAVEWYDSYAIGIDHVDEQHKTMVRMIARLQDSLSAGNDLPEIGRALRFLVDYTQTHFKDEEDVMLAVGFDEYDHHKELHKKLVDDIVSILTDLKRGKKIDMFSLIDFLTEWLVNHIQKEDKKIGRFIERLEPGGGSGTGGP